MRACGQEGPLLPFGNCTLAAFLYSPLGTGLALTLLLVSLLTACACVHARVYVCVCAALVVCMCCCPPQAIWCMPTSGRRVHGRVGEHAHLLRPYGAWPRGRAPQAMWCMAAWESTRMCALLRKPHVP